MLIRGTSKFTVSKNVNKHTWECEYTDDVQSIIDNIIERLSELTREMSDCHVNKRSE